MPLVTALTRPSRRIPLRPRPSLLALALFGLACSPLGAQTTLFSDGFESSDVLGWSGFSPANLEHHVYPIVHSHDDAEEIVGNGSVTLNSQDLDIGAPNNQHILVGLRFQAIDLPPEFPCAD